ncbi:MAG: Phosphoglycerate mutase [Paenibacillus sp.]|jgi:broad specificity phosphatase PhoE|nr:Phosphoglycerate mutase [Paenibacillus sp.]
MINTIWLLRHGMRLNFEDENWIVSAKRPYDSPLSQNGILQANETARFLINKKINHIFSSPFQRTLQTSNTIAEILQVPVHAEEGLSEWLNPAWFQSSPEIISFEEAVARFPTIKNDYKSFVCASFPEEDLQQLSLRVAKTLHHIVSDYN